MSVCLSPSLVGRFFRLLNPNADRSIRRFSRFSFSLVTSPVLIHNSSHHDATRCTDRVWWSITHSGAASEAKRGYINIRWWILSLPAVVEVVVVVFFFQSQGVKFGDCSHQMHAFIRPHTAFVGLTHSKVDAFRDRQSWRRPPRTRWPFQTTAHTEQSLSMGVDLNWKWC